MQSEGDEMYSTVFEIGPKKSHKKLDSIKTQFPDKVPWAAMLKPSSSPLFVPFSHKLSLLSFMSLT